MLKRVMRVALVMVVALQAGTVAAQAVRVVAGGDVCPPAAVVKGGRLVVFLIRPGAVEAGGVGGKAQPMNQPFERDPQPIFGVNVAELGEGAVRVSGEETGWTVGGEAAGFMGARLSAAGGVRATGAEARGTLGQLAALAPGQYRVQAALIVNRELDWHEAAGNLYSEPGEIELREGGGEVTLKLVNVTKPSRWVARPTTSPATRESEEVVVRSAVLSRFAGREMVVKAGVQFPLKYDATRKYAAVYEIPGFGGDHLKASGVQVVRGGVGEKAARELAENTFRIVLNPQSAYGHSLWMNSDSIGPWADALITELVPELERRYGLVATPEARILTGHSSGGWSTLWLATEYPETFGATWSTSPDPVDFRRFERVNIYEDASVYVAADGSEIPSARIGGKEVTQTARQENAVEHTLGPGYTSAQQWASWQACWGRRDVATGGPRALFDPVTGEIQREEAESYRRFDISDRLAKDPGRFVPIFRNNVRLLVGTRDDYYLNEAVVLLKARLDEVDPHPKGYARGYIEVMEGGTHGSVPWSERARGFAGEMMEHLVASGLVEK